MGFKWVTVAWLVAPDRQWVTGETGQTGWSSQKQQDTQITGNTEASCYYPEASRIYLTLVKSWIKYRFVSLQHLIQKDTVLWV